ncbi:zinc finger protein ZFPM1-like isoform X2 [Mya arenaria]|uniref:zinc finger protein ZFPM1-like isoform X2 n=1 Tax=Mya arenaria TaxID=6604 RepID=UPI0022E39D6C|nr:zinc finger protein ZFPM1-like isoform X2 [Mya arenaria]
MLLVGPKSNWPEDEEDEKDVSSKESQSEERIGMEGNQSETELQNEKENEPMEEECIAKTNESDNDNEEMIQDDSKIEHDRTSEEKLHNSRQNQKIEPMSPRRLDVMKRLHFPVDLLTLRQVDESEFLQTGIPWSVSSQMAVPRGSTIGPYQGETIALSSIKPGELVLQFQGNDGEFSFIKVTEETGAWLSLLRPADASSTHNTSVYFEGGRIWCEIVEDLDQGTELLACFTTGGEQSSPLGKDKQEKSENCVIREPRVAAPAVKKHVSKSGIGVTPQPALIYGCPFCSVRFSSQRTLEAHLQYYCSKKPADFVSLQELQQRIQQHAALELRLHQAAKMEDDSGSQKSPGQVSPRGVKRSSDGDQSSDSETSLKVNSPQSEVYRCKICTFSTDRLSTLHRHQTSHSIDTDSGTESERLSVSPACVDEMYCKECKIQFSSVNTFRGHKEFYCRFNLSSKDKSSDSEMASPGASNHLHTASELAMKLLKSPPVSPEAQLLAAKGQLQAALLASNPLLQSPLLLQELLAKSQQEELNKALASAQQATASKTVSLVSEDQPLDLSKPGRRESEDSKPSVSPNKAETSLKSELKSPNEQLSPASKRIKLSDEKSADVPVSGSKTPLNIPSLHPSMLLGNQTVQFVNKKPIPPLQSVSRCVECNIVFYKHENFLIHKEHYCSGRHASKDSASDSDNQEIEVDETEPLEKQEVVSKENVTKEPVSKPVETESKQTVNNDIRKDLCYKYFCIPCKIKFSSAGTLKAHKEFYCPHGKENASAGEKEESENGGNHLNGSSYHCENCKGDFSSARLLKLHICMGEMSPAPLLRCLYCDYVTQTENRLSEHMKVHVPTKAFKCNLCGYRGNTARGMRMHGKVHMESGVEFTDDNMIEFQEPPLVPIQRNGMTENKGPVDVETELIRMKNEPYKRRRSRKSFEKSENMVPFLGQNLMTQICAACGQTFTNVSDFVIHLRMHEIAALEAMKNLKSLRCEHCSEYVAESLTALLVHMQTKHPEQFPGTSRREQNSPTENESSRSHDSHVPSDRSRSCSVESSKTTNSMSSQDNKLLSDPSHGDSAHNITPGYVEVKVEKESSDSESEINKHSPVARETRSPVENDLPTKTKTLRDDSPINERLRSERKDSASGHSKKQQLSNNHESSQSPGPEMSPESAVKVEPKSPSSQNISKSDRNRDSDSPASDILKQESKLSTKLTSPDPKTRYLMNIKQEQMSPPAAPVTPKKSPPPTSPRTPVVSPKISVPHSPKLQNLPLLYNHPAMLAPFHFPTGIPLALIPPAGLQMSPPAPVSPIEKPGRKYCKHCDINFTYLSSFLTHKKYYCSARNTNDGGESPTATA